ncbi:tudor domain protein [Oesophagostomum dentatum]|uniref:Tudor domain protein n=1 Tax=Oesophagostomum dentatum TaxID=61180 RepID=A0A0B1SF61_OESDE|nr:tudor domain protein [Oesophagostomum dentatum]
MSHKDMARLQRTVMEGVRNVMRSHTLLVSATGKAAAQQTWAELTNGITALRRTLSKLEAHAYDVLSTRFERVNVNCGQTKRSHSDSSDPNDNESQVEKVLEEMLSLNDVSEDEFDIVQPISEKEISEEWSTVIRTISTTLPPPQYFKKGDRFLAKVLSAVSPLEFYVIKVAHISVLREMERILSYCDDKLCRHPLLDSQCHPDHACLVRFEDGLARATIGVSGALEMQVYLVDYGRSLFISRTDCFAMPKCIAQYAPPLAHNCTLNGKRITLKRYFTLPPTSKSSVDTGIWSSLCQT